MLFRKTKHPQNPDSINKPCCLLLGQLCSDCGYDTQRNRELLHREKLGEKINWDKENI